jgi:LSD1 subclass zinc finger protein
LSIRINICPSCSAPVHAAEGVTKVRCAYCGSPLVIDSGKSSAAIDSRHVAARAPARQQGNAAQSQRTEPPQGFDQRHNQLLWILFSLKGRVGRVIYWFILPVGILGLFFFAGTPSSKDGGSSEEVVAPFLMCMRLVGLILVWSYFAVAVKRYHDLNKAGWWALIAFIPVFGPIWQLVELAFYPGTPGPNRFDR